MMGINTGGYYNKVGCLRISKDPIQTLMDLSVFLYLLALALFNGTSIFIYPVLMLCAVGCFSLLLRRRLPLSPYIVFMILFIAFAGIHTLAYKTQYHSASMARLTTTIYNFVVNFILFSYMIEDRNRDKASKYVIWSAIFLALYIIFLRPQAYFLFSMGSDMPYPLGLYGANGRYLNTNAIARFFALGIFSCMLRYQKQRRPLVIVELIALLWGLLATGSRGNLLLVVVFLALYVVLKSRTPSKVLFRMIILAVLAFGLMLLLTKVEILYNHIGNRLEGLVSGFFAGNAFNLGTTESVRYGMALFGIDMFLQKPLFGWGLDSFASLHKYKLASHNNYVELLASLGLVGFLLYYAAILYLCVSLFKEKRKKNVSSIIMLAFLVAVNVMSISAVDYFERVTLFAFYFIAAACYSNNQKQKAEANAVL